MACCGLRFARGYLAHSHLAGQWREAHRSFVFPPTNDFPPQGPPDKPQAMPCKVAAFYQFAPLPDFRELREPLRALCASLRLKGSVLLACEGINGTLAGS